MVYRKVENLETTHNLRIYPSGENGFVICYHLFLVYLL